MASFQVWKHPMCWIRAWAPQGDGMGWATPWEKTSRKFVFFVEKPRQNDMESCEVVLSFNVNVMCFISFVRVYMSILVKPCQLSGRCPLSPLKKKPAEFRGIRLLLEIQVVAEKAKTSPKSTSNNHSSQGLLSILFPLLHISKTNLPKPSTHPLPPISASKTVKPPGSFSLPCF